MRAPQLSDDDGNELDWAAGLTPELRENYGPVANPFDEDLFFGKLDWEFSDADRLELSAKSGSERQQAGAAGIFAESAASTYVNDDDRCALRWEHAGRALLQRGDGDVRRHRRRAVEDERSCPAGSSWP